MSQPMKCSECDGRWVALPVPANALSIPVEGYELDSLSCPRGHGLGEVDTEEIDYLSDPRVAPTYMSQEERVSS